MAMLTRVPLFYSATKPTPSPPLPFHQCHKCSFVANSNSIPSSSLQILRSSISTTSHKGFRRRRFPALSVVAMADSAPPTVLVTGAGGRTGNSAVLSLLACFLFSLSAERIFGHILDEMSNGVSIFSSGCGIFYSITVVFAVDDFIFDLYIGTTADLIPLHIGI